jgi:D-methionine transport system ATP-binding protein
LSNLISLDRVSLTTASQRPKQLQRKGMLSHNLLQDISTDFRSGEVVGIVGATGAGKTSLLRLLNRLVDPTQGTLLWQSQPYSQIPVQQLRQQIMLIPQEPKLLGMTVAQAIVYGLQLRQLSQEIQSRSAQWQQRLQIPHDWLDKTEASLSIGQRQWVTIARGLICETPVVLLDEPTAHLDDRYCNLLRQVLTPRPQGLIVIASHDIDWLSQQCDRVLYLQQGRLVKDLNQTIDWHDLSKQIQVLEQAIEDEWG